MESKYIYTVTAMGGQNEESTGSWLRSRVWGWYSSREAAHDAVIHNVTDMNEAGYYNYIVVEKLSEGILPLDTETYWYKFNDQDGKYHAIDQPQWAHGIVNWSMG